VEESMAEAALAEEAETVLAESSVEKSAAEEALEKAPAPAPKEEGAA
jgi:hypothetical protein